MEASRLNNVSFLVIQAAIEVHRTLGPGLLESVYRACLVYELRQRSLGVVAEQIVPICYKDVTIEGWYRLDLLVEDEVLVEIKACRRGAGRPSRSALVVSSANEEAARAFHQLQRSRARQKRIKRVLNRSDAAALGSKRTEPVTESGRLRSSVQKWRKIRYSSIRRHRLHGRSQRTLFLKKKTFRASRCPRVSVLRQESQANKSFNCPV